MKVGAALGTWELPERLQEWTRVWWAQAVGQDGLTQEVRGRELVPWVPAVPGPLLCVHPCKCSLVEWHVLD